MDQIPRDAHAFHETDSDDGRPLPSRNPSRAGRRHASLERDREDHEPEPAERDAIVEFIGKAHRSRGRSRRLVPAAFGRYYGDMQQYARQLIAQDVLRERQAGDVIVFDDPLDGIRAFALIEQDAESWLTLEVKLLGDGQEGDTLVFPMNNGHLGPWFVTTTYGVRLFGDIVGLRIGWIHLATVELIRQRVKNDIEWRPPCQPYPDEDELQFG